MAAQYKQSSASELEMLPRAPTSHSSRESQTSREENSLTPFEAAVIQRFEQRSANTGDVQILRPSTLLGRFSVFCVIANRMIGSGIFRTPSTVVQETRSVSGTILFWCIGAIVAIAGTLVFVEFGQSTPRIPVQGQLESVPANGGEKNYLEYVYYYPKRLATCLFGISFICFGNMAGNTILFGESIYIACTGREPGNGTVRGIAIAVATLACFLHIYSRHLGIIINNWFGVIKVLLLLVLILIGIFSVAGTLPEKSFQTAHDNYVDHGGFGYSPNGTYGYTDSFLSILFAYGGFNQANYILGNMRQPRQRFKSTALLTVSTISVLYIVLNLFYYCVVPYEQLIDGSVEIATAYFGLTLSKSHSNRISAAFIAFSSLGNIIIQTFTASRVKQELAKEGILPWSRFFARNRTWRWKPWSSTSASEATPFGALLLHWSFCIILILGTYTLTPQVAYSTYVSLYSFIIDALFGFFVGLGLLILRISDFLPSTRTKWFSISTGNKHISLVAALIFTAANLYPLIAIWIRPAPGSPEAASLSIPFFVTGTVGFATVGLGFLYWVVLQCVYPWITERELVVDKRPVTRHEHGEIVVINDIVDINWVIKERRD